MRRPTRLFFFACNGAADHTFYKTWGRLLYDPETPDSVFEKERYGNGLGGSLLKALSLGSRMPLRLASFHAATWDYTLYSEGFLAPVQTQFDDEVSPFISVDELIKHSTLDPEYLSIPDFVEARLEDRVIDPALITPLELADRLEEDGRQILRSIDGLARGTRNRQTLECEMADMAAWGHLSLYFADKLRGAVSLHNFRSTGVRSSRDEAISSLELAGRHWQQVVEVTEPHYRAAPAVQLSGEESGHATTFAWADYVGQVQRDVEIARSADFNQQ